jgi:ribosomal-protein-alanine N-acetyltransferase
LLVHPDNEPARALYDSLGFDVIDRRPGFYDDADALVMAVDASAPDSRGES